MTGKAKEIALNFSILVLTCLTHVRCGSVTSLVLCEIRKDVSLVHAGFMVADVFPRRGLVSVDAIFVYLDSLI